MKLTQDTECFDAKTHILSPYIQDHCIRPNNLRPTFDPIGRNDIFLQRADDQKIFSKGEVNQLAFDDPLQRSTASGGQEVATYIVTCSKVDRTGNPLVRNIKDKTEVQFSLFGKKVVLEFKIKELVNRLEDL